MKIFQKAILNDAKNNFKQISQILKIRVSGEKTQGNTIIQYKQFQTTIVTIFLLVASNVISKLTKAERL